MIFLVKEMSILYLEKMRRSLAWRQASAIYMTEDHRTMQGKALCNELLGKSHDVMRIQVCMGQENANFLATEHLVVPIVNYAHLHQSSSSRICFVACLISWKYWLHANLLEFQPSLTMPFISPCPHSGELECHCIEYRSVQATVLLIADRHIHASIARLTFKMVFQLTPQSLKALCRKLDLWAHWRVFILTFEYMGCCCASPAEWLVLHLQVLECPKPQRGPLPAAQGHHKAWESRGMTLARLWAFHQNMKQNIEGQQMLTIAKGSGF